MAQLPGGKEHLCSIGELSERSGVTQSALHFYERKGLLHPQRNASNQRVYPRGDLRRVAFIRTAQKVGISLAEIKEALDSLPDSRTPTLRDWRRLSENWRQGLDDRIAALTHLRNDLLQCIGCGCLSLGTCTLNNPEDALGEQGSGPVLWEK